MKIRIKDLIPLLAVIAGLGLISVVAQAARSNSPVSAEKTRPMVSDPCGTPPDQPPNE